MDFLDSRFQELIQEWHSVCDSRVPAKSYTTPSVAAITSTYDPGACNRLQQSCISGNLETEKCSQSWMPVSPVSYASCACQTPIYSLFSECQFNGNVSCSRTTADESNILGYSQCSYFWKGSVSDGPSMLGIPR